MKKCVILLVLLAFCTVASATNPMIKPNWMAHFENTTTFNLDLTKGDYTQYGWPGSWLAYTAGSPTHGTGFIGNGLGDMGTAGDQLSYWSYIYASWNSTASASSLIDVDEFSAGGWFKMRRDKSWGYHQVMLLNGSRTSEDFLIDYSGWHAGKVRIDISGGEAGAGKRWMWQQYIYTYDSADPNWDGVHHDEWLYIGASFKMSDVNTTLDQIIPHLYDSTGTNIKTHDNSYVAVTQSITDDREYRLNNDIFFSGNNLTYPGVLATDEVNIQGQYLTNAQVYTQVQLMVAGDDLDVPEPATMALLALGGLALIRRRK